MTDQEFTDYMESFRADLARQLEDEIRPMLVNRPYEGGYNCCGCSTYEEVLDHAIRIVKGEEAPVLKDEEASDTDVSTPGLLSGLVAPGLPEAIKEHWLANPHTFIDRDGSGLCVRCDQNQGSMLHG